MGDGTTINIPVTLRDRLDRLAARETLREGKKVSKADLIERWVTKEEGKKS